jgi:hypothetical protein
VTRTVDDRTDSQKTFTHSLFAFGCLSLLLAFALVASLEHIPAIKIEGEKASVPLTLAGETRQVEVVRINGSTYKTAQDVALVKCPQGRRKSVYRMPIQFRGDNGKYRPDLYVWISTGRGRAGGYYGKAFQWSAYMASTSPKHKS